MTSKRHSAPWLVRVKNFGHMMESVGGMHSHACLEVIGACWVCDRVIVYDLSLYVIGADGLAVA